MTPTLYQYKTDCPFGFKNKFCMVIYYDGTNSHELIEFTSGDIYYSTDGKYKGRLCYSIQAGELLVPETCYLIQNLMGDKLIIVDKDIMDLYLHKIDDTTN